MLRRLLSSALLFAGLAGVAPRAAAVAPVPADRTIASQAGWTWLYNVSGATLSAYASAVPGLRLADLRIHAVGATNTFDVAFIANAGEYAVSGWWWYYDVTSAQIASALTANHARLLTLDRYVVAGQARYCCVMVANTGAEARSWWWALDQTSTQLGTFVNANNARIFAIHSYDAGFGARRYDALMISNTGSDALPWYYLLGQTPAQLGSVSSAGNLRVTDLSAYTDAVGNVYFDDIMIPNAGAQAARWYWWYGLATGTVGQVASNFGCRVALHQAYASGVSAAIMVQDVDPLTERIGNELEWATDGTSGCYFKQVGGPVTAAFNEQFVFEPASAIKPLAAIHLMRLWDLGLENLAAAATYNQAMLGSCPLDGIPVASTERRLLWLMLKYSDNAATQWFRKRYGNEALNATAATLGMTATAWHHRIGCADSILAAPNHLTLADIGRLQEEIQLAQACTAAARDTLHQYFENEGDDTGLRALIFAVVDDEAAGLGLGGTIADEFKAALKFHFKQGGYGLSTGGPLFYDRSAAGWVYLPNCASGFRSGSSYVFGSFVQAGANDTSAANRSYRACSEMMRGAIHQALGACPLAVASGPAPDGLEFAPPMPNPARGATVLRWSLPVAATVRLTLVDVSGRQVAPVLESVQAPGAHSYAWDGRAQGRRVAPGVYFVRLQAGSLQSVQRLSVVR